MNEDEVVSVGCGCFTLLLWVAALVVTVHFVLKFW
jgi:hypothetical protein